MKQRILRRADIVYPDLSYRIVGAAFDVYNELGPGHSEAYYQKALAQALRKNKLRFEEQVYFPLKYDDVLIGKKFLDFLVEDKVVVEIKKGNRFSKSNIDQVLEYIRLNDFLLGILVNFGTDVVSFKRLVNITK